MSKLIKSVVVITLMAVIMVNSYLPAMAAERTESIESTENVKSAEFRRIEVANFSSSKLLTKDKVLGTVHFSRSVQSIDWIVPGSDGNVIFKMTNKSTGEVRSFTTTGNGILSGITYNTAMPAGTWEIKVHFVTGIHFGVNMWFYY